MKSYSPFSLFLLVSGISFQTDEREYHLPSLVTTQLVPLSKLSCPSNDCSLRICHGLVLFTDVLVGFGRLS